MKQSGFQAAYGASSSDAVIESFTAEVEKDAVSKVGVAKWSEIRAEAEKKRPQMRASFLMIVFPVLLILTILMAFFPFPADARLLVVGVGNLTALALLLTQMAIGFPVHEFIGKSLASDVLSSPERLNAGLTASLAIEIQYTPWFHVAVLSTFAGLVAAGVQWQVTRRL